MAEATLHHEMARRNRRLAVRSAGFLATGEPIDPDAAWALERRGVAVPDHRSSVVDEDLVGGAFLVLTMTAHHVLRVVDVDPSALGRTFTLREFVELGQADGGHDPRLDVGDLTARLDERRDRRALVAVGSRFDIEDPHGRRRRHYRKAAQEIHEEVDRLAALLADRTPVG